MILLCIIICLCSLRSDCNILQYYVISSHFIQYNYSEGDSSSSVNRTAVQRARSPGPARSQPAGLSTAHWKTEHDSEYTPIVYMQNAR